MGVNTVEEVCNLALLRIGDRQTISDINANSAPARACRSLYAANRDLVLESFPWPFAEREAELAEIADAVVKGWDFVYQLPNDCVRAEYIFAGIRNPPPELRVPFKLCLVDDTGGLPNLRALATDQSEAVLVYTSKVTRPALWSNSFVEALAWKLAWELALSIPAKKGLAMDMAKGYLIALGNAGAISLNQAQGDQPIESRLIRERNGGSTLSSEE